MSFKHHLLLSFRELQQHSLMITLIFFLAVVTRFLPHPPNFTPMISIAILSTAYFKHQTLKFILPLLIMFVSDLFLGLHRLIPVVYCSLILAGLSGYVLKSHFSFLRVATASLLGPIIFFLSSNFGVWIYSTMYAKTLSGLMTCYIAALPFFHNCVLSTFLGLITLFGLLKMNEKYASNVVIRQDS